MNNRILKYISRRFSGFLLPKHEEKFLEFDRIYNVHIRKCAGSSLAKSIIRTMGGNEDAYERIFKSNFHRIVLGNRPVVGWNKSLTEKGAFFYAFSHLPFHKLNMPERTYTFTFLRDPVDRIISHFNMLRDFVKNNSDHPAMKAEMFFAHEDFDVFLERIPRIHLENQLYMFAPNFCVKKALINLNSVNFVGHVSSIEAKFIPEMRDKFKIELDYTPWGESSNNFIPQEEQ